jgi:hypothetical protein
MPTRQRGIYELLVTEALDRELAQLGALREDLSPYRTPLRAADAADRIALHVSRIVERALSTLDDAERSQVGAALARRLIDLIVSDRALPDLALERPLESADVLRALRSRLPDGSTEEIAEPKIPLLDTTLLTNAPSRASVIKCWKRFARPIASTRFSPSFVTAESHRCSMRFACTARRVARFAF